MGGKKPANNLGLIDDEPSAVSNTNKSRKVQFQLEEPTQQDVVVERREEPELTEEQLKKIEENRQKALAKKRKRLEMEQMQNEIPEPAPTNTIGEKKFGDKGNEEVKLDTSFDKLSLEDEEHIDLDGLEDYLNDE